MPEWRRRHASRKALQAAEGSPPPRRKSAELAKGTAEEPRRHRLRRKIVITIGFRRRIGAFAMPIFGRLRIARGARDHRLRNALGSEVAAQIIQRVVGQWAAILTKFYR